jgi:hypothetical protein
MVIILGPVTSGKPESPAGLEQPNTGDTANAGVGPGSRSAVLRRSEGTRFSSVSDDEVGGLDSAIRASRCSRRRSPKNGASAASTSPSGELCAGGADETRR